MNTLRRIFAVSAAFIMLTGLCTGFTYADAAKADTTEASGFYTNSSTGSKGNTINYLACDESVKIFRNTSRHMYIVQTSINGTGYASKLYIELNKEISPASTAASKKVVSKDIKTSTGKKTAVPSSPKASSSKVSAASAKKSTSKVSAASTKSSTTKTSTASVKKSSGTTVSRGSASASRTSKSSSTGSKVVSYAKNFLGVQYVWGGTTPDGFDCSGFIGYVYAHYGIYIDRVASDQAQQGIKVSKADLRPGDLVFFDTDGGHDLINHVGMYIGDDSFIHASSGRGEVTITSLSNSFYVDAYMTARRYF